MLSRFGWIGVALATGLLLHIAVQIQRLHWLPDFPLYPGLALLAGGVALLSVPMLVPSAAGNSAPSWWRIAATAGFAPLAICHAVLAANASSSAIEWWRDALLWPALLVGVAACWSNKPTWQTLPLVWSLGEAAVAVLACWYAPSWGESQSWRAYQTVIAAAFISFVALLPVVIASASLRKSWALWGFAIASLALPLICLIQPEAERAQSLINGVAILRLLLLLAAVWRWLAIVAAIPQRVTSIPPPPS